MVITTILASAIVAGVPWPVVVLLAGGTAYPVPVAAAFAAVLLARSVSHRRPEGPYREAVYLAGVAAELRRGASLRAALMHAAAKVPDFDVGAIVRAAVAGAPIAHVADALRRELPVTARLVVPTVELAAESGGRAALMFDRLALRAADEADAGRQLRAAAAQARLSAWVVGGLPVVAVAFAWTSGRLELLVAAGPIGAAAVTSGALLLGLGLAAVAALSRGAAR